ncbi:helix-turn-helix domain-containing protein [Alkalihalobacillus sp. AL-G]|uniref:helix-turn-helix domain-containing protein n=1 Tax=Alkalihalobacillus sp. AL-G TaxID=2926399 RepID=UPI00272DC72E|nr:helix-turn-helix transcriptional regulator [Alkalihalobacillus sp. AL-G]WLD91758.1 helix-turn-helix transcriptional regulator [Alkalihalobacillus sp. AL-G]
MDKLNIKQEFGTIVKDIRKKKGISQEGLAELTGLHRTYISDVERGSRNISIVNMSKICRALGVKISCVFQRMGE